MRVCTEGKNNTCRELTDRLFVLHASLAPQHTPQTHSPTLQMSRDAAEALRLAIGAPQLDESFPEVAERRRLEYQESELMRAIESWHGRRTAAAQVRGPAGNHTTAAPRTLAFVNLQ